MNLLCSPTCTDAHYEPSHDDDLVGLGNFADPHHHSGDDGEDVVEEEGALPVTGLDGFQGTSDKNLLTFDATHMLGYLPSLLTRGATIREPKKPPSGYMETERDQRRVRKFFSMGRP